MSVSRRSFLNAVVALPAVRAGQDAPAPAATAEPASTFPTQSPDLVREMVGVSHNNLARVEELLARHPTLARAAWDWGFGDWEDALGAASHVGNRAIAETLLAHGARPTIFSAAMLGQLDAVKAFVAASPGIEATPGPHGITLLRHATAGGPEATPVVEYLRGLPSSDRHPEPVPLAVAALTALAGDYVYGSGEDERIAITVRDGTLFFARQGRTARGLTHVGDRAFFPAGAPLVRIRFQASGGRMTLTVHDPSPVIEARRSM